jgi:hypothetical protein
MDFNEEDQVYTYPCPCGDKFEIFLVNMINLKYVLLQAVSNDDLNRMTCGTVTMLPAVRLVP